VARPGPGVAPPDVGWEMTEWGIEPGEFHKVHRFAVVERHLYRDMGMIAGAGPALRRLSNLGIRIRIITHRLVIEHFHRMAVGQTVEWLDRHGIPYWDLCFMGEKGAVNADLYLEDGPHNIEALLREQRDVVVFSHAANRHLEVPAGDRAATGRRRSRSSSPASASGRSAAGRRGCAAAHRIAAPSEW